MRTGCPGWNRTGRRTTPAQAAAAPRLRQAVGWSSAVVLLAVGGRRRRLLARPARQSAPAQPRRRRRSPCRQPKPVTGRSRASAAPPELRRAGRRRSAAPRRGRSKADACEEAGRAPAAPPRQKIRTAGVERRAHRCHPRRSRSAAAQAAESASRPWPKMPSPGPAGQVDPARRLHHRGARQHRLSPAHRRATRCLAGMPKVVVPVVTKPRPPHPLCLAPGHRPRANSRMTVCRNLRRERRSLPGDRLMETSE